MSISSLHSGTQEIFSTCPFTQTEQGRFKVPTYSLFNTKIECCVKKLNICIFLCNIFIFLYLHDYHLTFKVILVIFVCHLGEYVCPHNICAWADEMVNIYILFIRSIVEYCCVVWHNSIMEEESNHIERVQKIALRIILNEDYTDYSSALELSGIETLKQRRTRLSHNFAKKCIKTNLSSNLFPLNIKAVNTRPHEKYHVTPARTERLAKSTIPYLQRLLNVNS